MHKRFVPLQFKYLLLSLSLLALLQCSRPEAKVTPAFYYWKTTANFTNYEKEKLKQLGIRKIYLRLFDIKLSENKVPVPAGKLAVVGTLPDSIEWIPVVYITNNVFSAPALNIDSLAFHLLHLLQQTMQQQGLTYREIQIDCDWTGSTKAKYFALLQRIRELEKNKTLSATIRLHQIKYHSRTGIPPVSRGMLMFYNMGKVQDTTGNSIYSSTDAGKYIAAIKNYTLPLDVALAVFGWTKHFRNGKLTGLKANITEAELTANNSFRKTGSHSYTVVATQYFNGERLQAGDQLVYEAQTPELVTEAAELLKENFRSSSFTAALFSLDSLTLSRYENHHLQKIYSTLR